jgi:ABC-type branched-subunit amino acid transport system substrate-binding protein
VVRDSAKKIDLANLLQDFLSEWPSQYVQSKDSSEWKKATDEAWLIIKYTIKWTRFEPDTFLAGEILDAFRKLRPNIKINEENIRNGLIEEKIKDILNNEHSKLSEKLQEWIDQIIEQKKYECDSVKKAIKEICESSNSIDIRSRYEEESGYINRLVFVNLDGQKSRINYFYKENFVLKNFINSAGNTIKPDNMLQKNGWSFATFGFLALFGWAWISLQPTTIAKLCSEYKNNELISCFNEGWDKTITSNNLKIKSDIENEKGILKDSQVYSVAVVVPDVNAPPFITKDILEGVAQQQSEFNNNTNNKWKIFVVMAKESRNPDKDGKEVGTGGESIADHLANQNRILGVIGPYASTSLAYVRHKYCEKNLNLVSPTVKIPIANLIKLFPGEVDTKCFFRVTGTNDDAIKKTLDHLKLYKRILVVRDYNDAFANSFWDVFTEQIKSKKLLFDKDQDVLLLKGEDKDTIKAKISGWQKQYNTDIDKTAILMIKGSKGNTPENTKNLIQANNGKFLIIASDTAYYPEILRDLEYGNSINSIKKMIIAVPYFSVKSSTNPNDLTWFHEMSYDATKLLTEAISAEIKDRKEPTRAGLQERFNKVPVIGHTGTFSLQGSDRTNPPYYLIQPACSTSKCDKWSINNE